MISRSQEEAQRGLRKQRRPASKTVPHHLKVGVGKRKTRAHKGEEGHSGVGADAPWQPAQAQPGAVIGGSIKTV